MNTNKKIKKRYIDYPSNVPRKLFKLLRDNNWSRLKVSILLSVNTGYISQLFDKGIEPTDATITGRLARKRLFLPIRKHRNFNEIAIYKPKIDKPQFIKDWSHLPTAERHKVIQEYLSWKKKLQN